MLRSRCLECPLRRLPNLAYEQQTKQYGDRPIVIYIRTPPKLATKIRERIGTDRLRELRTRQWSLVFVIRARAEGETIGSSAIQKRIVFASARS